MNDSKFCSSFFDWINCLMNWLNEWLNYKLSGNDSVFWTKYLNDSLNHLWVAPKWVSVLDKSDELMIHSLTHNSTLNKSAVFKKSVEWMNQWLNSTLLIKSQCFEQMGWMNDSLTHLWVIIQWIGILSKVVIRLILSQVAPEWIGVSNKSDEWMIYWLTYESFIEWILTKKFRLITQGFTYSWFLS